MALTKLKKTNTENVQEQEQQTQTFEPTFEEPEMTDIKTETKPTVDQPRPVRSEGAETETAVVPAKEKALTVTGGGFSAGLSELENQIDLDSIRSLGVGTLPKLVADRGGFEDHEGTLLGDWVKFQIVSFNRRWLVSGGVEGEEGKELLRTSYDNETLEGETMTVREYVQYLKDEGYEKADVREYIDIWGFIEESEKAGVVNEEDYELIQMQLSPSSVRNFMAYRVQAGVQAKIQKREVSNKIKATIERREHGGNRFAAIKFSAA